MSMERNGLNMKDDDGGGVGVGGSVGGSKRLEDSKVKDSWGYHRPDSISSGLLGGFSWPPRSYTCSFCKREFTSAQALGGHMNVHRRDRAKLRQWPPWDVKSSNPDPNPNPNFVPSSTAGSGAGAATRIPQFTNTFTSSLLSSVACFSSSSSSSELNMLGSISPCVLHPLFPKVDDSKGTEALLGVRELKGFVEDQKDEMCVRLDLEIGLCGDLKEDLDLELRLGHS